MDFFCSAVGRRLAHYLSARVEVRTIAPATSSGLLLSYLIPGDVILVEGNTRISGAIRYLTQSTWSHAALFVGDHVAGRPRAFVEADLIEGVRIAGADEFEGLNTRICRPVGLTDGDRTRLCQFAIARVGQQYDLRNIIDLARYLLPTPPVPQRFRRKLLALGSGSPTRAICSTLIALAFQEIGYPILPGVRREKAGVPGCDSCFDEILSVRHHSLFVPRDFDVSPYFAIVKPTVEAGFDYLTLIWEAADASSVAQEVEAMVVASRCADPHTPDHERASSRTQG